MDTARFFAGSVDWAVDVELDVDVLLLDAGVGFEGGVPLVGQPGAKELGEARSGPPLTATQPG